MLNIVLYHPEIPQNTGNILRTAAALGAHVHVIGPLGFSFEEKHLKRAGMDYIDFTHLTIYADYASFDAKVPSDQMFYISRYGERVYSEVDFSHPEQDYWLMFGAESTGIDYAILKAHPERTLRVPMLASTRSLNLANTVALVSYEVARQQRFIGLATQEQLKGTDFLTKR